MKKNKKEKDCIRVIKYNNGEEIREGDIAIIYFNKNRVMPQFIKTKVIKKNNIFIFDILEKADRTLSYLFVKDIFFFNATVKKYKKNIG